MWQLKSKTHCSWESWGSAHRGPVRAPWTRDLHNLNMTHNSCLKSLGISEWLTLLKLFQILKRCLPADSQKMTKNTKNTWNTLLSLLWLLRNGITELVATWETDATGCKIIDNLEVGIANGGGQKTTDPINGMDDPGVKITHSTDKNLTTPINMDTMVITKGLPMATTDRSVSNF